MMVTAQPYAPKCQPHGEPATFTRGDRASDVARPATLDRDAAAADWGRPDDGSALRSADEACAASGDPLVDTVRSVLARLGKTDWRVTPDPFWCHVQPPDGQSRVQGWKLHVSATPMSAPLVLARSAEVLVRHRCPFKFAGTIDHVRQLTSRHVDRGSGGKFLTAYPEGDDEHFRALADQLHRATEALSGPGILSDRPYRPESLVHYRFGAFTGVRILGNDGAYETLLVAPDGSLVPDERKAWFTPPTWAPPDPLTNEAAVTPSDTDGSRAKPVLLDGRFLVTEVIRHAFGGGVYRATDQQTDGAVIIKQARRHTSSEVSGEDARDLRRHEANMLELFGPSGLTPRLVSLFEQQGDVFLVQEQIPGVTLRQWGSERTAPIDERAWGPSATEAARFARKLVELVALVHAERLVLRDLNPSNVLVTEDGDLRLIDLEMLARPGDRVSRAYTSGYGPPEVVSAPQMGPAPQPSADLYSLGATLVYLVSGIDPLLPDDEPEPRPHHARIGDWLADLSPHNPAAGGLAELILALLHDNPAKRPTLDDVRGRLTTPATPATPAAHAKPAPFRDTRLDRAIADATDHLLATMKPESPERLWQDGDADTTTDPFNVQFGAAGVLGVLVRAFETDRQPALRDAVSTTAGWIRRHVTREPRALPGLHFGRSGTAWALLDAGLGLGDDALVRSAVHLARQVPVRWPNPDVCHGVAGAGLTQLRFWEATDDEEFLGRARQAADALVAAAQHRDGIVLWPVPHEFPSAMAGLVHYGFAHGVAGVGAFLLAAGRATGDARYLDLAQAAADTLASVAELHHGGAYWPIGPDATTRMTHWCSGASGVGSFLVRMWRHGGHSRFHDLAARAAVAVHRSRWHAGPAQCHGLAGDGEFLLDLAEASGERRYHEWADELAANMYARHALRHGRMLPPDDTGTNLTAAFGTGLSGALAFLLRLRDGGPRLWLPQALTGSDRQ